MTILLFITAFLFNSFTIDTHAILADYTGEWEYKVETPQGPYVGVVVLEKTMDGYSGHIASSGNTYDIKDLEVDGDSMKFNVNVDGFPVLIKGTFSGDTYTAVASVEGMEIPFVAVKKVG